MNIIKIPGTKYIALGDDMNLTPRALVEKTIGIEYHLAGLPVVQNLNHLDHVIDVGAFIGDTAVIFLKHTRYVTAIEPQEDAFFCLEYNCPDATCINVAAGDGTPVVCSQDPIDGNLGTRTVREDESGYRSVPLDEMIFFPKPTLIKIDVEGFEPAVLRGARKTILHDKPALIVEIFPELLARHGFVVDDIYNFLREVDYSYEPVIGNNTEPRWDILCLPHRGVPQTP